MKGIISMSIKETERITVMDDLIAKRIKQKHAAKQLGISVRQVQRIVKKYKREGISGLVHLGRGKPGNRTIPQTEKDRAIGIIKERYSDFGPTFALEKLKEYHRVAFGVDTLRKEMTIAGLWNPKKRKTNIHPYRERKACIGELVQLDGSPHDWFEKRGPYCTLIIFIDDATSRILDGMFVEHESTFNLFAAAEHYLVTHGKPLTLYVDKHSTFKINRQANIEEDLKDSQAQSQFTRAMEQLQINLIYASSPQAKGRVERVFETLQDRLVKEMRLRGIKTMEEGTKFLREVYIPKHNARFAVLPKEKTNLHRPLSIQNNLSRIFTVQSKRHISKDLIVQYKNTRYLLLPEKGYRYTLKHASITIEENKKGRIVFSYKGRIIPFSIAVNKIHRQKTSPVVCSKDFKENKVRIPSWNHPWRQAGYLAIQMANLRREAQKQASVMTQEACNYQKTVTSSC